MTYRQIERRDIPERHPVGVLYDFWSGVKTACQIAPWASFDPVEHPTLLPWLMLLRAEQEPDGQEVLRYTVCGTACTLTFGFSYQGKIFGADLPPDAVSTRRAEFERVRAGQGPILSATHLPIKDREHVRVLRGVFPFSSDGHFVERLMVALAPEDEQI